MDNEKANILIITQWFDPEPIHKGLLFANKLSEKGFRINVITGFPNYPGGKIYKGFKLKLYEKIKLKKILLHRVFLFPSHDKSSIKRAINYISFAIMATLYGLFKINKPDIIYAYHPPLTVGICGAILKKFYKVPLVYDIQDMWPDTLKATGMVNSKLILKITSKLCKKTYKLSDKIIVLSNGFRNCLIKRGVEKSKIEIIYNWSNIDNKNINSSNIIQINKKKFNIIFAGNIGKAQSLETLLYAAEIIKTKNQNIDFHIIGDGIDLINLKNQAKTMHLDNIKFIPRIEPKYIGGYLNKADAFLVHLRNNSLFKITIPSKTQTYMAFGKPIIMAVNGDAADLIKEAECGIVTEPQNPKQLAIAIEKLVSYKKKRLNKIGLNGLNFYNKNLAINKGIDNFASIFESLLE